MVLSDQLVEHDLEAGFLGVGPVVGELVGDRFDLGFITGGDMP